MPKKKEKKVTANRVVIHAQEMHINTKRVLGVGAAVFVFLVLAGLQLFTTLQAERIASARNELSGLGASVAESAADGAAKAPEPAMTSQEVLDEIRNAIVEQAQQDGAADVATTDSIETPATEPTVTPAPETTEPTTPEPTPTTP